MTQERNGSLSHSGERAGWELSAKALTFLTGNASSAPGRCSQEEQNSGDTRKACFLREPTPACRWAAGGRMGAGMVGAFGKDTHTGCV